MKWRVPQTGARRCSAKVLYIAAVGARLLRQYLLCGVGIERR